MNVGLENMLTEHTVNMEDEEDAAIGREEDGLMTYIAYVDEDHPDEIEDSYLSDVSGIDIEELYHI